MMAAERLGRTAWRHLSVLLRIYSADYCSCLSHDSSNRVLVQFSSEGKGISFSV